MTLNLKILLGEKICQLLIEWKIVDFQWEEYVFSVECWYINMSRTWRSAAWKGITTDEIRGGDWGDENWDKERAIWCSDSIICVRGGPLLFRTEQNKENIWRESTSSYPTLAYVNVSWLFNKAFSTFYNTVNIGNFTST